MSLRKSPTRTAAMLAANRANAQKSTGPRTAQGKAQVAFSRLRHGRRSPNFLAHFAQSPREQAELAGVFRALCQAILPVNALEIARVRRTALEVWAAKRSMERWAASRTEREAFFNRSQGVFPEPWTLKIKRRGWWVTITVWVGRGRCKGPRRVWLVGGGWQEGQGRLHTVVTVTSSLRHPVWGYPSLAELPEGRAPRVVFPAKPESDGKQKASRDPFTTIKDWLGILTQGTGWGAGGKVETHRSKRTVHRLRTKG